MPPHFSAHIVTASPQPIMNQSPQPIPYILVAEEDQIDRDIVIQPQRQAPQHPPITLQQREEQYAALEAAIDAKRGYLRGNESKLRKIRKQNEFLHGVRRDYNKYNSYIVTDKMRQMQAMELLNKYISELADAGELSADNIRDARAEQEKIVAEMAEIRGNLNRIIDHDGDRDRDADGGDDDAAMDADSDTTSDTTSTFSSASDSTSDINDIDDLDRLDAATMPQKISF